MGGAARPQGRRHVSAQPAVFQLHRRADNGQSSIPRALRWPESPVTQRDIDASIQQVTKEIVMSLPSPLLSPPPTGGGGSEAGRVNW